MDRRTFLSEREHEDTVRVVPRLQLDYQTSIASWHRGVPVTLGLSKVVPWLRRPLTAQTRVRAFSSPCEDLW